MGASNIKLLTVINGPNDLFSLAIRKGSKAR